MPALIAADRIRAAGWRRGRAPAVIRLLCLLFAVVLGAAPASAGTLGGDGPPAFGATLDWGSDAARAYVQRLGARPAVLDKPAILPLTGDERRYVEQFFDQAVDVGAEPSLTLQPTVSLDAVTAADLLAVARLLRTLTDRYRTEATVTLAPQMNSASRPYGLRPRAYVRAARRLAVAAHRVAPRVDVVWSPDVAAQAASFSPSGATAPAAGSPDFRRLDTDADGALDGRDDPYAPYWPGARYVDAVGLSVLVLGAQAPSPDALTRALRGPATGGSGDFYLRFAERMRRPLVLRTAAGAPGTPAEVERQVKAAWEHDVLATSSLAALPRLRQIVWLELQREEPLANGARVDWQATRTPALASDLLRELRAAGVRLGESAPSGRRPGGGHVLSRESSWMLTGAAGAIVLVVALMGLSGRPRRWRYPDDATRRDERIDLLRGVAICFVVIDHLNIASLFALLSQEAIGPVSGAELFVALSGMVVGIVYRPRAEITVRGKVLFVMWARARKLYVTALAVVIGAYLTALLPVLDAKVLTTFTDQSAGGAGGATYDLYDGFGGRLPWPPPGFFLRDILTLKLGPFQFNIMGLYVILLVVAPFLLRALKAHRVALVLLGSVTLYAIDHVADLRVLPSQFEDAFPLLTWQVLFVAGLVAGWYRGELLRFAGTRAGRAVVALCVAGFFAGLVFAASNPYLSNGYDARLSIIPAQPFTDLYDAAFTRTTLGLGRLTATVVVLVTLYSALTAFWTPIRRVLGPALIPLGQATLYVFVMHVAFALLVANVPLLEQGRVLPGTLAHAVVLVALWVMVKRKFLFGIVPR